MKNLANKLVNSLTGKDLKTILHPRTQFKDEINITTDKDFYLHGYIMPMKKIHITEDNGLIGKIPKKSNIKDIGIEMDSQKKRLHGDKLKSLNDEYAKTMWVDRFHRSFSSKIETADRITFNIRADIANDLFLQGKVLIQCTTDTCDIFLPTKGSIDMGKFIMQDPNNDRGF